ncbi:6296_t:CDS:2 [Acaulospora colombiana]|uniref:6296_t:CDS:1 n=1 Tax=Acaulospora colombiana TaxID=27376 RepID=A0ACA9K7E6_9GLOM|nr:6296_t:CDS:2 [Acaulospora colombiana]
MSRRYIFVDEGHRPIRRKVHTSNLFDLLQLSLRERNYCRANRIVEILLQCPEANIELIWQAAVDVLRHLGSSKKVCLEFFNQLLNEILLELIFFQMDSGNPVEALETLETYLPQVPFCDNPLFHGYAGLLAYALWDHLGVAMDVSRSPSSERRRAEGADIEEEDEPLLETENYDDEQHMERRMRYYDLSARSFKMSLDLDIGNDMFLAYYIKLLLAGGDFEEALRMIDTFCEKNPRNLTGHRIRFETLYRYRVEDKRWIEAGEEYHKIDPSSPPEKVLNPLINHYEKIIGNKGPVQLLEGREIVDALIETRADWLRSISSNRSHKTKDHAGLYLLLAILLGNYSNEEMAGNAEKFREGVLQITSTGYGSQSIKREVDFPGDGFSDQSDNETASEHSAPHYDNDEESEDASSINKRNESDFDDLFADALSGML